MTTVIKHHGVKISTPFAMVIFGATGDLTARKLAPALYDLFLDGVLPKKFFIIGFARRPFSDAEFRNLLKKAVDKHAFGKKFSPDLWEKFARNIHYQQGSFGERAGYDALVKCLKQFDTELSMCVTRFFYLATPPSHYETILKYLKNTKLSKGCGQDTPQFTRVLIEKPFGKDLETAKALDAKLASIFRESQVYRIDHYLGKETVQNILAFRFANKIFEPIWNSEYIDHVQITMSETLGIGTRGRFYDGVGALRDVAQNHLLQLLALVTMEEPENFSADAIAKKRVAAIEAIKCIEARDVGKFTVRGQYRGDNRDRKVKGYREERNVDPKSQTETFVAMKLFIDAKRWKDVPFYLRTGKRLKRSVTAISMHFRRPVRKLFGGKLDPKHCNVLTFYIQPREGISLTLETKQPGFGVDLEPTTMDFRYRGDSEDWKPVNTSASARQINAYERILVDSMVGDQTLFPATRGIMASWKFIGKILKGWQQQGKKGLFDYDPGSWGPKSAHDLLRGDWKEWYIK